MDEVKSFKNVEIFYCGKKLKGLSLVTYELRKPSKAECQLCGEPIHYCECCKF